MKKILMLLFLGFLTIFSSLVAEEEGRFQVQLVVLGPGPEIYTWWGHTGIVIDDRLQKRRTFYDFGNFSFEEDHFYRNFLMGRLIYQGVSVPADLYLRYASTLGRELNVYTLKLSQEKAIALDRLLKDQVSPENRNYLYDHFEDNCSTRIRDYLDFCFDGRLREITDSVPAGSFRSQFRRFSYSVFPVDFVLNYLQGVFPDQPISWWDAQFLPTELERAMIQLDREDSIFLNRERISDSTKGYSDIPEKAPQQWPISLLWGGMIALICGALWVYYERRDRKGGKNFAYILISLLSGIPGSLLFFMSFFTDHHVTFHNSNLLFSSPLVLATLFLYRRVDSGSSKLLKYFWTVLTGLALVLLFKDLLLNQGQQNGGVILFYLPQYLLLTLGSWGLFPQAFLQKREN